MFKLKDRNDADLVLAMTHEEVVTCHVAREVRSYRELPQMLVPLPDEGARRAAPARRRAAHARVHHEGRLHLRPRRGGPAESYEPQIGAYDRIFERCGLDWYEVESRRRA